MTLGGIHGSGTILGSITLASMAAGQALATVSQHRPRPQVDDVDHRNRCEAARTQNIWLFGA
jgi:hypothetical protein